jgi:hypothetical protein
VFSFGHWLLLLSSKNGAPHSRGTPSYFMP